ncbi:hypothetical protein IEQ34_009059 [Dendrobium chrysotoxum]|uniref:Uncharacterized protein n=1 Tax=Dendrobium chrysotoxum TaxID=161865 RepID=A0AAV7H0C3_DENCH|nr:hypothetical protein IEQ34_009059 [Dendrobium chrysotoxum]
MPAENSYGLCKQCYRKGLELGQLLISVDKIIEAVVDEGGLFSDTTLPIWDQFEGTREAYFVGLCRGTNGYNGSISVQTKN